MRVQSAQVNNSQNRVIVRLCSVLWARMRGCGVGAHARVNVCIYNPLVQLCFIFHTNTGAGVSCCMLPNLYCVTHDSSLTSPSAQSREIKQSKKRRTTKITPATRMHCSVSCLAGDWRVFTRKNEFTSKNIKLSHHTRTKATFVPLFALHTWCADVLVAPTLVHTSLDSLQVVCTSFNLRRYS